MRTSLGRWVPPPVKRTGAVSLVLPRHSRGLSPSIPSLPRGAAESGCLRVLTHRPDPSLCPVWNLRDRDCPQALCRGGPRR